MLSSVRKWLNTQEKSALAYVKELLLILKRHKMLMGMPEAVLTFCILNCFETVLLKKKKKKFSKCWVWYWTQIGEQIF